MDWTGITLNTTDFIAAAGLAIAFLSLAKPIQKAVIFLKKGF